MGVRGSPPKRQVFFFFSFFLCIAHWVPGPPTPETTRTTPLQEQWPLSSTLQLAAPKSASQALLQFCTAQTTVSLACQSARRAKDQAADYRSDAGRMAGARLRVKPVPVTRASARLPIGASSCHLSSGRIKALPASSKSPPTVASNALTLKVCARLWKRHGIGEYCAEQQRRKIWKAGGLIQILTAYVTKRAYLPYYLCSLVFGTPN